MSQWSTSPIFDSYATVMLVGVALLALLIIGPNFARLSPRRRAVLVALRVAVIGLVILGMLRPSQLKTIRQSQPATIVLLADQSRSMRQPNASGEQTRWGAQRAALDALQAVLPSLSPELEIKLYGYDAQLHAIDLVDRRWTLPAEPVGDSTDLGTNLSDALGKELGKRIAGVVLLGDGVQTALAPRVEVQQAGREVARLGYPLYTIVFGPAGDRAQARDVAVESLRDQYTVFVKNELEIRGQLRIRGYANQEVPVELLIERVDGARGAKPERIGAKKVLGPTDDRQVEVAFPYVPQEAGQYKLTLQTAVLPGELVTKNNQLSSFLTVLEGGLKVLYLEGELRHEQRFLARALDGSPDIHLDVQWIDRRQRERWPVDLKSLLEDPKYDAFVIGDLDSTALGPVNLSRLVKAVEQGRGLMMLGGAHSFGPGGYAETSLANVLPIRMEKLERQSFSDRIRTDTQLAGPLAMVPARDHSIMRLGPVESNQEIWNALPPLLGANKFVGVKDAPGVQILATAGEQAPLLVAGEYGQGRVLAFAGDSTWVWAMRGKQVEHRRFWRQIALWLARREDLARGDVWIELAQRRFPPGSRVTFATGAKAATGEPLTNAVLKATLVRPDRQQEPLALTLDGQRWTGAIPSVTAPGDYRIELTATADGKQVGQTHAEFMVFDQDVELASPAADHEQMARLAALTESHGGRTIAPEQLPELVQQLDAERQQYEVEVQTRWQLGGTPGSAWLLLLMLVATLGVEWFLRKKWGLV